MRSLAILAAAVLAPACTTAPGSAHPYGTPLAGRVTFSPRTDALAKLALAEDAPPTLMLAREAGLAPIGCAALVVPEGATTGALAWAFATPDGSPFAGLQFSDLALRASAPEAVAMARLLPSDDTSPPLVVARATPAGRTQASPDALEEWIGGRTSFLVELSLSNPGPDRAAAQALPQCAGEPVPFSLAAVTTAQL